MYLLTDTERPNVTCSANQVVGTDAGRAFATVVLPPVASLSDNDGIASVQIEFNGSVFFPTDNISLTLEHSPHQLRYEVLDDSANRAFCYVIVTVVGESFKVPSM